MSASPHVWGASDLARDRLAIISAAEHGVALVRGTNGTLLVVTTAERVQVLEFGSRATALLASAVALFEISPSMSELGELGFAAGWPRRRRATLARDLRDVVLHAMAAQNPAEVDAFIEASRPRPSSGPVDPARIVALLGD